MAQTIEAPDGTPIDFPDEMPLDQIKGVMQKKFGGPQGATISAAPTGVGHWLEDLRSDIETGGQSTWAGRALHAMGAPGLHSGTTPAVGDFIGGPLAGPVTAAHGITQLPSHPVKGANEVLGGVMQALGPIAGATDPAFMPTVLKYGILGGVTERAARATGLSPETSELAGNIATLAPGAAEIGAHIRDRIKAGRVAEAIPTVSKTGSQQNEIPTVPETPTLETKPAQEPQATQPDAQAVEQAPQPTPTNGKPVPVAARPEVKRNAADLMAASEAKEAALTPEQQQTNRQAYLTMTKKYSGENAIGPVKDYSATAMAAQREHLDFKFNPLAEEGELNFEPIKGVLANLDKTLNPTPEAQRSMDIIRTAGGDLAQKHAELYAKYEKITDRPFDEDGFRAVMDYGQRKPGWEQSPISPEEKSIIDGFGAEFQKRWNWMQDHNLVEGEGLPNYLKQMWDFHHQDIGERLANRILAKRPLEGPATFRKHRVFEYASEGLDAGLKPVSYNPYDIQMRGLFEVDKYIMAHQIKDNYTSEGLAQWFKLGADRPEGWRKLDDKIFQPRLFKNGGLTEYGNYWAPREVADIFNNYLAPGLRGKIAYDKLRQYGNLLNSVQLGFSGFHATFEAIVASASHVGIATQKLVNQGDVAGAIKSLARSPFAAALDYSLGKRMEQEYRIPGTHPELSPMIELFKKGGGRIGLDPMYDNQAIRKFRQLWKDKNVLALPGAGLHALIEAQSKLLMKYYVPRLKAGAFGQMALNRMGELFKDGSDLKTIQTEMGKLMDVVDNRYGQMIYDNLFWKKTYKDLGFLSIRSMGWNIGTLREFGGGLVTDPLRQISALAKGQRARLTERMAFSLALPITVATLGAAYGYLTGNPPQREEDYFYPKTGTVDSNGKPERFAFPSYMKDYFSIHHDAKGTVLNKLAPQWQQAADLWRNQDFYGTEIRQTDDPVGKQVMDVAKFLGKGFVPLGVQASARRHEEGESLLGAAGGMLGFTPAPKYIGETPAEELAFELSKRHMEAGPHTTQSAEQHQFYSKVRGQFMSGKLSESKLAEYMSQGKLSDHQVDELYEEQSGGSSALARHVSRLNPEEMYRVWKKATPSERESLKEHMYDKFDTLDPERQPELFKAYEGALR